MKFTYITHPDVIIDPNVPVTKWPLSDRGRARMIAMLDLTWVSEITDVYCSSEQKALDGAQILGDHLGLKSGVLEELGENDRTSTGYLEQDTFLVHVAEFFARPEESIRGWEPAQAAQDRVKGAVCAIAARHSDSDHIAIVGHGGVGSLLLTSLMNKPVSLEQEQPGKAGGNYFVFDALRWKLTHGWKPITP